ncbi:MAG: tetratricopeptide repeat protein [Rhodomicrobium sp.]
MSRSIARFLFAAAIGFLAGAASAQTPAPGALVAQAEDFAKRGDYRQAILTARKALISAEKEFGVNDPRVVKALRTLARLLELQRQYAEAKTQYQRALSILERAHQADGEEAAELKLSLMAVRLKVAAAEQLSARADESGGEDEARTRSFRTREVMPAPIPQSAAPDAAAAAAGTAETMPFFPWPPPRPSTTYPFPPDTFSRYSTVGEVSTAILSALERSGYVERSFFQTADGGVALVTRLERIASDGAPADEAERWPAGFDNSPAGFVDFVRGLFFAKAGHYRVIVFVLQDKAFSVSQKQATGKDAETWLNVGFLTLPPEFASRPFGKNSACTALIYEFASDGSAVHGVVSSLTGRQHLQKAGVLTAQGKLN